MHLKIGTRVEAAITVTGVHKHYRNVHALKGLDLTIHRGEFFGLLGPNGAGKSTLINIIAGLVRADSGCVAVLGHDVVAGYRRARAQLGVVPQELVFDPFFTVREVLRIQAGYFGLGEENAAWIDELLEALQLKDKANSNMRALSGGMKRRVLIAQALVHKPKVLVLDEPTAGVDVELRQSLWHFVRRLHGEGHTIVLTTPYLAAPLAMVPPSLADKLKQHDGERLEFHLDKGRDSIMSALDAVRATGAQVVDVQTEEADLEDIFVELTKRNRHEPARPLHPAL